MNKMAKRADSRCCVLHEEGISPLLRLTHIAATVIEHSTASSIDAPLFVAIWGGIFCDSTAQKKKKKKKRL
jgi:hypothetical protein